MARANPTLWEKAKSDAVSRMGGKHSARAMQHAASTAKKRKDTKAGKQYSSQPKKK